MKRITLLLAFFLLLFIGGASAALSDGLVAYYNFSASSNAANYGPYVGSMGANSTRVNASGFCIKDECLNTGRANTGYFNTSINFTTGQSYTINAWIRTNSFASGTKDQFWSLFNNTDGIYYAGAHQIAGQVDSIYAYQYKSGSIQAALCYSGNASCNLKIDASLSIEMFTITYNATTGNGSVYVNGTYRGGFTDTRSIVYPGSLLIGNKLDGTEPLGGYVDEVSVYNVSKNASDVLLLWNGGSGNFTFYYNLINIPTYFSLTAANLNDSSSVTTFQANVTINGTTAQYGTTNGTINFNFTSGSALVNVTAAAPYYVSNTTTNYNTSANLAMFLPPYATIYATDRYDGSNITAFNVTYAGTNYSGNPARLPVGAGTYTATLYVPNYFPYTITNANGISKNTTTTPYQAVVNFTAYEIISGNTITIPYTITATNGQNSNGSSDHVLYMRAGTQNITFNSTKWYNKTFPITITALENDTQNLSGVYQFILNITARNIINGTTDNVFTVAIASGVYNYTTTISTTTGNASTAWVNDTNINLSISNTTYLANTTILYNLSNFSTTPLTANITLLAYTTNTFNIAFFDEETGALITGTTINAFFTGTVISYNYTTTNGYLNATLIMPQAYVITYGGGNYTSREKIVTLTNGSIQFLSLYLLSNNTGTSILFTVLDSGYNVVRNANIVAQKKNLSGTNYYGVQDCYTDNNGECVMFLQTLGPTYRFIASTGSVTRTTSDTILSRNTYNIVIDTAASTLQDVFVGSGIEAGLNFTSPDAFYYTVYNPVGTSVDGSLIIQRRYGGQLTTIGSTTGSGSSFTITLNGINTTLGDEIIASGYVTYNGVTRLTHTISVIPTDSGQLGAGMIFLFLGLAFSIVFIFAWNPIAPLIAFGAFLLIMSRVGLIAMGTGAVIAFLVVVAVAIYRMRSV